MIEQEYWARRRVLVTGGSGFLGSHLCKTLCQLGAEVHATSRADRPTQQGGPMWWKSDLTSLEEVQSLLSKGRFEVVYHLAGSVGAKPDLQLVQPTFQSLLLSTINLLIAGTEVGCRRIILAGSLTEPRGRQTYPTPTSPYAAAKWAASGYGRMFHALFGTPSVVLTPYMTFGPGQHPHKLIPSVILSLLKGEVPRLTSGRWEADWIYVEDVVRGFLAGAQAPDIEGMTFDIGSGLKSSVRRVVELIVQQMGSRVRPAFGEVPDRPMEPVQVADVAPALQRLGWECTTTLEKGLRQTIDWYTTNRHVLGMP
jgi:UDP-glucose 4-epimerase